MASWDSEFCEFPFRTSRCVHECTYARHCDALEFRFYCFIKSRLFYAYLSCCLYSIYIVFNYNSIRSRLAIATASQCGMNSNDVSHGAYVVFLRQTCKTLSQVERERARELRKESQDKYLLLSTSWKVLCR